MKELKVLCHLYLEVEDDADIEAALDSLIMKLDSDVDIQVYEQEIQEV